MLNKYVITKIKLEGKSKRKVTRATKDLQSRVFSDVSKEELTYFLADELKRKSITLLDLSLRDVTPR